MTLAVVIICVSVLSFVVLLSANSFR